MLLELRFDVRLEECGIDLVHVLPSPNFSLCDGLRSVIEFAEYSRLEVVPSLVLRTHFNHFRMHMHAFLKLDILKMNRQSSVKPRRAQSTDSCRAAGSATPMHDPSLTCMTMVRNEARGQRHYRVYS